MRQTGKKKHIFQSSLSLHAFILFPVLFIINSRVCFSANNKNETSMDIFKNDVNDEITFTFRIKRLMSIYIDGIYYAILALHSGRENSIIFFVNAKVCHLLCTKITRVDSSFQFVYTKHVRMYVYARIFWHFDVKYLCFVRETKLKLFGYK